MTLNMEHLRPKSDGQLCGGIRWESSSLSQCVHVYDPFNMLPVHRYENFMRGSFPYREFAPPYFVVDQYGCDPRGVNMTRICRYYDHRGSCR